MIIDAHLHVWDLERGSYPWLTPALAPIDRTLGVIDVVPELDAAGIDGVVLVQASDDAGDTERMLAAARVDPRVLGVVAWSPLDDPDVLAADLARFAADPWVVGLRNLVHERPPEWLARPVVEEGFALLAAAGLPLDVPTTGPAALRALPGIGERHPALAIVIDHLGKPPIGGTAAEHAEWRAILVDAAANPRVSAKVSGLYATGGDLAAWTPDGIRPFVADALELFGPDRLMYGGDWPIAELAGGYRRTWTALSRLVDDLAPAHRLAVLGGTAARVYALPTTPQETP